MKPAPFAYESPRALTDALRLLGGGAKALAGGQSLMPLLNFRLARPERIVDLNQVAELRHLRRVGGTLRIGALTRHVTLERSELVARDWPLLEQAVRFVGHPAIRARGTIGGSVAHADPTAELPAALSALDARFQLRSAARGERSVAARDFFRGPMETVLEEDELLTEILVPPARPRAQAAFVEHARTHGDFAIAGVALLVTPGEHAAIALLGAGPTTVRAEAAERALVDGAQASEVAALAARDVVDEYRRALLTALVLRALETVLP
jgi:CO/xanthine dehydrogenase FAD-binding subunit